MELKEQLKTGRVLVDFYADWCGPCKVLGKTLEAFEAEDTDVTLIKINVDNNQDASTAFAVKSIPTLIYMEDGEVLGRQSGNVPLATIKELTKTN